MIIGGLNLIIVRGVYKTFKGLQNGTVTADKIDESINQNSMMGRAYKRLFKFIDEPWQIYPIGVLFGLGFDTATQVAFLHSTSSSATNVSMAYYLVLPLLFTAGMVTVDLLWRIDEVCIWLGVPQAAAQNLLEPDNHCHLSTGCFCCRCHRGWSGCFNRDGLVNWCLGLASES